jgi:NitT/TauT family transport system ATP-binding protein
MTVAGQIKLVQSTAPPASERPRPSIQLTGLRKEFLLGKEPFLAVRDVSLAIMEGEFFTLVGPSGCGKSTLLNIIAGLEPKSAGSVLVAGNEVTKPSRDIGMMFQTPVLLPWRSNVDNVLLPAEVFGIDKRTLREKAISLLELVGLGAFAYRYPFELSGGMQQRVAICRMLLCDPTVLLMDEPFSALDEMTREFLNMELLRIWQDRRKTVLFVTHNISEAVLLSDRIGVMAARPGHLQEVVTIDLPRPRNKGTLVDPHFFRLIACVRRILG